jgi:hypothetical protein
VIKLRFILIASFTLGSLSWGAPQQILSNEDADEFARLALNNFWGKAIDENDKPLQPRDETDRKTIPIPQADVRRVVRAGVPAGIAMWAKLGWENYYHVFMKKERSSRRWSGKQIAFIGVLFGVAQGNTEKSLSTTPLDPKGREWAAHVLEQAQAAL